jgi:hypothetical protein
MISADVVVQSESPVPTDDAKPSKRDGGLSQKELETFLDDMKAAPSWRVRADIEADYYDGNQHDAAAAELAQQRNLPLITVNLVAPTINVVLGMEAKTRTDWVVKPASDDMTERQADALTAKLNEAERNAHADRACSDAYAGQIKTGLHWVEVGRNQDPFAYQYRVSSVSRREIWWDMRDNDPLLQNARWLVRKKWHDVDHLTALMPGQSRLIDAAMSAENTWDMTRFVQQFPMLQDTMLPRDLPFNNADEWRDTDRRRACAYEVWYRRYVRGVVLKFPDGRAVEYDARNLVHNAAIVANYCEVINAVYPKMRLSWWLGPFRLQDFASPLPHNGFPYTPFWGFREDLTGVPYGMIRAMKSLQDEVNARRAKMMWQLSAVRVIVEEDAVHDHQATAAEAARPDAYIKLNKKRMNRNAEGIRIEEHQGLSVQQFNVYQDAKRSVQQSVGVFGPMLGDAQQGAEAGVAIDMLIQQGSTTLAEINDNYRLARTQVGTQLLSFVLKDMAGKQTKVSVPTRGGTKASITLNRPAKMPNGITYLENDVTKMLWSVALADVPNTPSHRQQRMKDLVEYAKSLPDEMKVVFADIVVMASDLPDKEMIAERIRKITGQEKAIDPEKASPEELAEIEAERQQRAEQVAKEEEMRQVAVDEQRAKTENMRAAAELARAKTGLTRVQSIDTLVEMGKGTPDIPGGEGKPATPGEEPASLAEVMAAAEIAEAAEAPIVHPGAAPLDPRVSMGPGMQP